MSIDVERELKLAMEDFTADVQAPPDLLSRLGASPRPRRFPRIAAAVAAAAAAATIGGVVLVGEHTGGGTAGTTGTNLPLSTYRPAGDFQQRHEQAVRDMDAAIARWGRIRGDRSGDRALLTQLRHDWSAPSTSGTDGRSVNDVMSPDGPVTFLYVGTTPQGVTAFAVQHTKDPAAHYWYGVWVANANGSPELRLRGQLEPGDDFGGVDPHLLSFATSMAYQAVVVLPTNPDDIVRAAFTHRTEDDRVVPEWQDVPTSGGVGLAVVPARGSVWGALLEVTHDGHVAAIHGIDYVAQNPKTDALKPPSNALGQWCNGCAVGGVGGPGFTQNMITAWVVRHGPAAASWRMAEWTVGTRLEDGTNVLATQLWLVGETAHTVVLVDSADNRSVEVLVDEITDPTNRPVVVAHLPARLGWLVGAGPDAVITGWRTSAGNDWHPVGSKKAMLLPTDAGSVQLRLIVHGKQTVVTR